jgi:glutamine synthetase
MPKPVVGDNGSGMHVHQSVWKGGTNLFAGDGYAGLSEFALYYIGGIIKHAKALNAITNPGTNSYKRLVPGFEAPINLAYSAQPLGLLPHPVRGERQGPPCRGALPGSHRQPVPRLRGDADGGPGRVQNKIHPGDPLDKNLYDLEPEEAGEGAAPVRLSRRGAGEPRQDRAFLPRGGVFTDDMIDAYIKPSTRRCSASA